MRWGTHVGGGRGAEGRRGFMWVVYHEHTELLPVHRRLLWLRGREKGSEREPG